MSGPDESLREYGEELRNLRERLEILLKSMPKNQWPFSSEIQEVGRQIQAVLHRVGLGCHIGLKDTLNGPKVYLATFPYKREELEKGLPLDPDLSKFLMKSDLRPSEN